MTGFRVLGPVEVWADDRQLTLGGRRQLKLFAFLLLNANRAVSADALIDAVWGPERDGAVKRLQMAMSRLRKALEPLEPADGNFVRTVGGGYLLAVAPGELDSDVFADRVREGRRALEQDEAARASTLLGEALGLWRGPALAEVAFEDFAQAEIRRLEELRLSALETRIDADLLLGRHRELIGELEAFLGKQPTRERLAAQLMTALYRAGRQADALEVYQRTRIQLSEELGLDPGPALKALQTQILEQAPGLDRVKSGEGHGHVFLKEQAPQPDRQRSSRPRSGRHYLLERDSELAAFSNACHSVASGAGRLLAVTGPTGIGKTALLSVAADTATEAGLTVVSARCGELERDLGWGLAMSVVEGLLSGSAGEQHELPVTGRARWALALIEGDELELSAGESSKPQTPEIIDGLTRFVTGLATHKSLALVIDDVQWADAPSLRWLVHLSNRLATAPILTVIAIRRGEREEAELLVRLTAAAHLRLSPEPLSAGATSVIVGERLRQPADEATRATIHEITGGNPFLLDQLVRHLVASPLTPESVRAARPEGLRSLIWPRLLGLGEDARALAEAVAVLGMNTPLRRAAGLAGLPRSVATSAAERLGTAALFEDALPLNFVHPLVREVVLDGLGTARLEEMRRTAARELIADGADPETAAVQLLGTEAVDEAWAADLLLRAADRANSRGAHESAARFFLRAELERTLPEDVRRQHRVAAGRALIAAGRQEGTRVLQEALTETPDPIDRARLALELGDALVVVGQWTGAVEAYEEGALAAGGHDERLRLHILARRAFALLGGRGVKEDAMQAVVEIRDAMSETSATAERSALALVATVTFWQGADVRVCTRRAEESLMIEPYGGSPWGWSPDLSWIVAILAYSDAYERRDAFLDEAIVRAESTRMPGDLAAFAWWRSFGHMRQGSIGAAEADARTALAPLGHRIPEFITTASYAAILINPLVARGALADAQSLLDRFDRGSELDDLNALLLLEARANLRRAQGRPADALADLERLQTEADRRGVSWLGAAGWPADLVIVLHLLEDTAAARRLAEEHLDRARGFGAASAVGRALLALGTVQPRERAVTTLEEAVAVLADSPARLEHARAVVALGTAMRERGEHESSVSLLDQAIELASWCGATPLVEIAQRELRLAAARR